MLARPYQRVNLKAGSSGSCCHNCQSTSGSPDSLAPFIQACPKLSTFKPPKAVIDAVAMKDEIPLGVVNEENEDECEQSTSKMTPIVQSMEISSSKIKQ